jgi:AAA15 family ATPase/GTPase
MRVTFKAEKQPGNDFGERFGNRSNEATYFRWFFYSKRLTLANSTNVNEIHSKVNIELTLKDFKRIEEHIQLRNFNQVNYFVGKNANGKSSILKIKI